MYSRHKCFQLPVVEFQSTRLSRASTFGISWMNYCPSSFQSTRLSRASTSPYSDLITLASISIHKALTSLDTNSSSTAPLRCNFNPQGSHEPRHVIHQSSSRRCKFQSTRLSRASTTINRHTPLQKQNFNPQGSHEPRHVFSLGILHTLDISIHKALTSLDSKNTQVSLYPCQIYIS